MVAERIHRHNHLRHHNQEGALARSLVRSRVRIAMGENVDLCGYEEEIRIANLVSHITCVRFGS